MYISISKNGKGKIYTFGFEEIHVTNKELLTKMNRFSISGPVYKKGHRKTENLLKGSYFILIDCDEPGQAEIVESKLKPYNYIKAPSASHSEEKPYKWHFVIPTQKPLSIYPAAFKWQVEQFFRQVGITDDMIDTTGSYDIARQFAPASIGMDPDAADELSHINDEDLSAPVEEPDAVLCKEGLKSISPDIKGKKTDSLPSDHLWYKGEAISYHDAIQAVKKEPNSIVSGFGCPFNNADHQGDVTRGYGFAFTTTQGNVMVECTGNACKEHRYFVIPDFLPNVKADKYIDAKLIPIHPNIFQEMVRIRVLSLEPKFQFGENMLRGFFYYGATFNECIYQNINGLPPTRYTIPAPTGSAKSVSAKLYLPTIARMEYSSLLIVGKVQYAIEAVREMNTIAGTTVAACTFTTNATHPDCEERVEVSELNRYLIIVITHNMFLSRSASLKNIDAFKLYKQQQRACCIIDEAIDFKRTVEFSTEEVKENIGIVKGIKNWDTVDNILQLIFNSTTLSVIDTASHPKIPEIMREGILKLRNGEGRVGFRKDRKYEDREAQDRDSLIRLLDRIGFVFSSSNIIVKQGQYTYYSVDQDLTNKFGSVVILDATAKSTFLYRAHMQNRDDILMYEMPEGIRNYQNATLHICKNKHYKQSKTGLILKSKEQKVLERVIDHYLEILYTIVSDGSKILVVTFMEIEELFKTRCQNDNITFIHWGQHEGTNLYSDYSKAAAIGWFRKPERKYIQDINAVQTNIGEYDPFTSSIQQDARAMIVGGLASDFVQFFNRSRSRVAIDENGNCAPTDFYIFDDMSYGNPIPIIKQEMPGIKEVSWMPSKSYPIIKKSSADTRAERIVEWLLNCPGSTINSKSILTHFTGEDKITQRQFKEVLKSPLFKTLLNEYEIITRTKRGRNGGTFFDIPEGYIDELEMEKALDAKIASILS